MVSLSVIVPATNDPPTLPRCINAIERAESAPEQLIVVRDADLAGPAAARNAGARGASGDILVFVDADIEVHADAFQRIRDAFAADLELVALFGSYDDAPAAPGLVSVYRNLLHHHVHQASAGAATTFWAGIGAVRRDAFEGVGGFDPVRFAVPSVEDIELGMRLGASGARIVLDPTVQGKHLKRWSLAQMVRTDLQNRGIPWMELLLESRSSSSALNLGWRHRLSSVAVLLALGGVVTRRTRLAAASVAALIALNHSFYALLAKRLGVLGAVAGVGLHAVHHLTAAVAVPAGLSRHVVRRFGGRRSNDVCAGLNARADSPPPEPQPSRKRRAGRADGNRLRQVKAPAIAPGVPSDYYERIRAADWGSWWYRGSRSIERALLGERLLRGVRLLDAGCGPGGYLQWAAASGVFAHIAGVDLGSEAVNIARSRVPEADLHVAPLHDLPFSDRSFDLIVMHDVLQHIPEDDLSASLEELRRVLDVGGALVIRTNGAFRFRRARADWRVYDPSALGKTLERAGFRCERLTYANMLPSLFAAARGRTPQAPTETCAGVPQRDKSRLRARIGGAVLSAEARYLERPGRTLPYGHSLWAVATHPA